MALQFNQRPPKTRAAQRPPRMRILRLGAERFFPQVGPGTLIVGVIQRGMQIGALAQLEDGSYAQINGSVVQTLNASQVAAALRAAPPLDPTVPRRMSSAAAPPVVTVKRRRIIERDAGP